MQKTKDIAITKIDGVINFAENHVIDQIFINNRGLTTIKEARDWKKWVVNLFRKRMTFNDRKKFKLIL